MKANAKTKTGTIVGAAGAAPQDLVAPRKLRVTLGPADDGRRMDVALAGHLPELSRSAAQRIIREGGVRLDGRPVKAGQRAEAGMTVEVDVHPPRPDTVAPEDIPLTILYEDDYLAVVDKPAGMVTHPAPGHFSGTLVNALLHHCRNLSGIGGVLRPGIVHRLDRDTSGVMVVAKNDAAHRRLAAQFKSRRVAKTYLALVWDNITENEGLISEPIGRDRKDRKKISVRTDRPRESTTSFKVKGRFGPVTLVEVSPRTGRTHQIRVHLAHARHPVVGDPLYGRRPDLSRLPEPWRAGLSGVRRTLLHASRLSFGHPANGREMEFTAPLPDDFSSLLHGAAHEG